MPEGMPALALRYLRIKAANESLSKISLEYITPIA